MATFVCLNVIGLINESPGNVRSGSSSERDATLALFLFASCIIRFELSIIFDYI
jgi:hypothetical protein